MKNATAGLVSIAVAIVGLATLAVLVSRNARTADVIGSAGKAFSGAIGAAVAPVMGGGGMSYGSFPQNF